MEQERLDADRIVECMPSGTRDLIRTPEVFPTIDSTNVYLMGLAAEQDFHGRVCLAEQQTAGRGRRGRVWVSPAGANIYLSLAWRLRPPGGDIGGLSVAIGMHVVRSMRRLGIEAAGLKWPNDIMLSGIKVAGILVEIAAARRDQVSLVAGIGINRWLNRSDLGHIGSQAAMLGHGISRNHLAGVVVAAMVTALEEFETSGLERLVEDWEHLDVYFGRAVEITLADQKVPGVNRGIDPGGSLVLETADGPRLFNAGEVSLRPG